MRTYLGPDGQSYDLSHLSPLRPIVSVSIDGVVYKVPTVVIFSNHCYSKSFWEGGDPAWPLNEERCFSRTRWADSLKLPEVILRLIEDRQVCHRTQDRQNFIRINDASGTDRYKGTYIFFEFSRTKADQAVLGELVKISITSYHKRDKAPGNIKHSPKDRFPVLLTQWIKAREDIFEKLKASE